MTTARLRIVAIVTAFAVLLAAGLFWLIRLVVVSSGPEWQSSAVDAAPTTPAPDAATADPTAVPTRATASAGPTAESTRPAPTRTSPSRSSAPTATKQSEAKPPVPRVRIQVGGVTLDNTNPDFSCTRFRNDTFALPVRVTAIVLSSRRPPDNPLIAEAGHCAEHGEATRACTEGAVLTPKADGCYIGVVLSKDLPPPGLASAVVRLALLARCTSRTSEPCDRLPARYTPTPDTPVEVQWTDAGLALCSDRGVPAGECPPDVSDAPS